MEAKFLKRRIGTNENGRKLWLPKEKNRITYEIGSDTISIINSLDENPMSKKIVMNYLNTYMVE